ncbi:MAG: SAM-dependent methyltransferase [Clostridia bacterium]|nr:SAM-dependent methyltransferase [Clostridia bacterium]
MQLEGRLKLIADLVPKCGTVADVGTDHGYIPIYCTEHGICEKAIAMDVNEQPLDRADINIKKYGLSDKIQTRLSDGLQNLQPGEADAIVIAGMGGQLIANIIEAGKSAITVGTRLILQPMIAARELRQYLFDNGFEITDEYVSREENKFYNIMVVGIGSYVPNDVDIYVGRNVDVNSPEVYADYLNYKIRVSKKILAGLQKSATSKAEEISFVAHELEVYERALGENK